MNCGTDPLGCTIFHKESQSTGQLSKLRTYYLTRNRLFYARRNLKGFNRIASIIYQSTVAATKNSLAFILKRAFRLGGSHILWSKLRTSSARHPTKERCLTR